MSIKKTSTANPNRIVDCHGKIVEVKTGDIGNGDTSYTYFNFGLEGYRIGSLQCILTATTLTLEATNDAANVSNANATWTDITQALFGVANFTTSSNLIIDSPIIFSRMRLKQVTTNGTNALSVMFSAAN